MKLGIFFVKSTNHPPDELMVRIEPFVVEKSFKILDGPFLR